MTAHCRIGVPAARAAPLDVLRLRAWARAYLFSIGDLDLHDAVDVLWAAAVRDGLVEQLGADAVQEILADEFGRACA